ncbi:MAG: CBS domain-containing protein [Candidatus Sericytochromatia bacterium]
MVEKNIVGVEKKDDQFPVFKSDIMDSPSPAIAPVVSISGVSSVAPISGVAGTGSVDAIDVWRYMSEVYKQRRLAKTAEQEEKANFKKMVQAYNNQDKNFQKEYEHDSLKISQKESNSWKNILAQKIHEAQLPVNNTVIEISQNIKHSSEDGVLKVVDVMRKPVISVIETTKIDDVIRVFNRYKITSVPVINPITRHLIGIFTVSDIMSHILQDKNLSSFHNQGLIFMQDSLAILEKKVGDYMNSNVIQVAMDTPIKEACKLMNEHKVKRVIVTEKMHVVGIFSASDAVKILSEL